VTTATTLGARRIEARDVVVVAAGAATLTPWVSPAIALAAGIGIALVWGYPLPGVSRVVARRLLAGSVVGLGAGMSLGVVAHASAAGAVAAAAGIAVALVAGVLLGRLLGVSRHAALLVALGTAICGGSAIAAASPAIGANEDDTSMALVTVFVLNAVALFLFPVVGHAVGLDAQRFGMWCALAIHDTSSVVGAASSYGTGALEVATVAKLARALWIVPVTVALALHRARVAPRGAGHGTPGPRARHPWFIAGFVAAAAIVTVFPVLAPAGKVVAAIAHRGLALTLFAIGLGLTRGALRRAGVKPLVLGVVLWAALAGGSLYAITRGWLG
jgi:uncharacterized integral membrane protein (TIGR00698 family)